MLPSTCRVAPAGARAPCAETAGLTHALPQHADVGAGAALRLAPHPTIHPGDAAGATPLGAEIQCEARVVAVVEPSRPHRCFRRVTARRDSAARGCAGDVGPTVPLVVG